MKIAFIHHHKAFLPELHAYHDFFQKQNIQTSVVKYGDEKSSDADVFWYFMGFSPKSKYKNKLIIHEYASASVPPYRKLKDFLKSRLIPRPHFRLYLNEYVREQIGIHDEVPFGYRDMGINEEFFHPRMNVDKEFDFIYTGNLSGNRNLGGLLKHFEEGPLKTHSLLMLGKDDDGLSKQFGNCRNISFQNAVPWQKVPDWLSRARFALNHIPGIEPFNAQTSTKFLEYAAMKMPIISTNYFWISEFQERYGGNYFLLKEDFSNMTWDRIRVFPFEYPNMESWHWEKKIKDSGILEFLRQA